MNGRLAQAGLRSVRNGSKQNYVEALRHDAQLLKMKLCALHYHGLWKCSKLCVPGFRNKEPTYRLLNRLASVLSCLSLSVVYLSFKQLIHSS